MESRLKIYQERYGLKERINQGMHPPNLMYCDTGEILKLLSTLGNLECTKLHIKVNEYFWRSTKAISFIIERIELPRHMKIRAIGRVALDAPLELKEDCFFLQRATESKGVERVEKKDIEGILICEINRILKEEYKTYFQNCFLCPVNHPAHGISFPYFVVLINAKDFFLCERFYKGIVGECMMLTFGMIKSASNYEEERMHHEKSKALLTAYVQVVSSLGTDMIYHEIQSQCIAALGGTSASVFVKNTHDKLIMKSSNAAFVRNEDADDKYLLTQYVYETGLPFNCKNPSEEPLFGACGMKDAPKTLLAFPIFVGRERLGVVEVYNKKTSAPTFDKCDVEMSRPLGHIIGVSIKTHNEFQAFISHKLKLEYSDCIFLRRTKLVDDYNDVLKVMTCQESHKYYRFGDIRFNPLIVPQNHVICFCLQIFEGLGLLKLFNVRREKFVRFLLKVRHAYNALPFRNWLTAFATLHFTFTCINLLNLIKNKYITPLESFAMLIAALCHCIDSRGSTTMFQMTSGTVLASLFSSPGSIAQSYHASQTLRLMNFPECNFLESLTDEKFLAFAILIVHMIKDTDLSYNRGNLKALNALVCNEYNFNDMHHRRLIHNLILNCAQMNFICKSWEFCRKIGENCFQEFFRKGDLSHANGVFEMSELNEDILKLPEMNSNFIESLCKPTFSVFINIFPFMSICIHKIQKNLKLWREEKEKILASMVQDALGNENAVDEDD